MNIKNLNRSIKHLEKMPEHQFDFSAFMKCDPEVLAEWSGSPIGLTGLAEAFIEYAQVPCGTLSCAAGEMQLEFAKSRQERAMCPESFVMEFLAIPYSLVDKIFCSLQLYPVESYSEVTLPMVIRELKKLLPQEEGEST